MTRYQVVVTCTQSPCPADEGELYFVYPTAARDFHSLSEAGARAEYLSAACGPGMHRYDVAELRPDGWPLCPWCGEDELYSLALHPSVDTICGCYRCGTTCPKKEEA